MMNTAKNSDGRLCQSIPIFGDRVTREMTLAIRVKTKINPDPDLDLG